MANPWSILGLRKSADDEQLWRGYAKTLRQLVDKRRLVRARDAFDAIEHGLWGRFADAIEPDQPDGPADWRPTPAYDGPLARELTELDDLLSGQHPIDEFAVRDRLDALFEDSTMRQAEAYLRVEPALADLLERHLPRSEPFVLIALDRFHHVTDQAREHKAISRLLDRADELALIEASETGHGGFGNGWRPLVKPASPLLRWYWSRSDCRGNVAALYAFAAWHNPRLRRRLDAGEWSWWSQELSKDRTSFGVIIAWLVAAVLMGLAAHYRHMPLSIAVAIGLASALFLVADNLAARWLISRRIPRPIDGHWTLIFAAAALALPLFTRLLPSDLPSAMIVGAIALAISWGLRLATGMPGGSRSSSWLDATALPVLLTLFFAQYLSIPGERYAMLASYAWLLHAVLPQLRRAAAIALDRAAALPWGYILAGGAALLFLAALFAAMLDINRESTRMALLVTSYGLLALSIYPSRPFPYFAALIGSLFVGGFLVIYCQRGGEYHPKPNPSAGETLLSAHRGDVLDWQPFPANGEDVLERIERNNPEAYVRLLPLLRTASCDHQRDGGRDCEAYPIDNALTAEVGMLLSTMSNRHLAEWTRLEARVRESQFRRKSGACSSTSPSYSHLDPPEIRRDYGALVLDIVASGPRAAAERPNVILPDLKTFELAMKNARREVSAIDGGPVDPRLRRACINQLVRARTILSFDTDVAARISRGGYP